MKFVKAFVFILLFNTFFMMNISQADSVKNLSQLIEVYGKAWSTTDEIAREKLIDEVWSASGVYKDPSIALEGRKALALHIGSFIKQYPKAKILQTSRIDSYGSAFRYGWKIVFNDGESPDLEGLDFGELDSQGRIVKIVGFFGTLPTDVK